ncbi:MAG: choice-of-anchor B family protein [Bdellovibrionota bacterium]
MMLGKGFFQRVVSWGIGATFASGLALSVSQNALASEELRVAGHFDQYSQRGYNDVWGYTAPDGREYALLGVVHGTSIIDITDPANLREVTFIPSSSSTWKDIKTYSHYAYVVNETSGGMQIIDLSKLPESAQVVNTYTGFSTSHNLYIDVENAMLYAEGNNALPVRMLSLADPVHPVQVGGFGVECHDIYVRNNVAFISEGGHGTIGIFDTSDSSNISALGRFEIPNAGYVHNSWLNEDGTILMTTEENDGKTVKLWDVSDLSDVRKLGEYLAPGKLAHNTHIKGHYAYISHYGSGLRIVDIADPSNPVEVAYYMDNNSPRSGFKDAWGAFPFFSSGKILMSDIENGLYVFEFAGARD